VRGHERARRTVLFIAGANGNASNCGATRNHIAHIARWIARAGKTGRRERAIGLNRRRRRTVVAMSAEEIRNVARTVTDVRDKLIDALFKRATAFNDAQRRTSKC
jgi:CRISPR/Cas system CMR-associated protein Cmr5 small subunit